MTNLTNTTGKSNSSLDNKLEVLQFEVFSPYCNLLHFMSTRKGGESQGDYTSLNLGYTGGDNKNSVDRNRKRLCQRLQIGTSMLVVPDQVHGSKIAVIDASFPKQSQDEQNYSLRETDALITNQQDICIAVTTADCVPILIYAPDKQVAAAIHAGWRGTVAHIATHTIQRMQERFGCDPNQMRAVIAPHISQAAFEVGEEVVEIFKKNGFDCSNYGIRKETTGKMHLHLGNINRDQLINSGMLPEHIQLTDTCTYYSDNLFYSARREGIQTGRMLTGICIFQTDNQRLKKEIKNENHFHIR